MKRSVIVLLSAVLSTGVATAASAQAKIGVVDIQRLATESPQAKEATEKLRNEFAPRQKEIETLAQTLNAREDRLKKDGATMTEVQKSTIEKELRDGVRDYQLKQSTYSDDLTARRQEEQQKIQTLLSSEVAAFAKANNYDLILMDAAYATAALDVTAQILQSMQARKAAPAAAPAAKPPAAPAKP